RGLSSGGKLREFRATRVRAAWTVVDSDSTRAGHSRTGCGAPKPRPATRALRAATVVGATGPTRRRHTGLPAEVPSCRRASPMPAPRSIASARSALSREPKAATWSRMPPAVADGAARVAPADAPVADAVVGDAAAGIAAAGVAVG